jgi:hypothetical protein
MWASLSGQTSTVQLLLGVGADVDLATKVSYLDFYYLGTIDFTFEYYVEWLDGAHVRNPRRPYRRRQSVGGSECVRQQVEHGMCTTTTTQMLVCTNPSDLQPI